MTSFSGRAPTLPTRRQKRWSGRLRMGGALLLLLGAAAGIDVVLSRVEAWPVAAGLLAAGALVFALGRRWSRL